MYNVFAMLLEINHVKASDVSKATGINATVFSEWKKGKSNPKSDKLQKIADYFGVTIEYLMTGKEPNDKEIFLNKNDERDISKDLNRIMSEIKKGDNGPLYYNGEEIDEASINLLQNAIEFALTQAKKENKVKYNPYKNKK